MSLYRFVRLTAVLALLRRYRMRLVRLLFLACFASVTAWQYDDVAAYLDQHHPQWSGAALIIKTLIVYAALFWGFWEVGRMLHGDEGAAPAVAAGKSAKTPAKPAKKSAAAVSPQPSALDVLAEKPRLRSRRADLLDDKAPGSHG